MYPIQVRDFRRHQSDCWPLELTFHVSIGPLDLVLGLCVVRVALWRFLRFCYQAHVQPQGLRLGHPRPRRRHGPHGLSVYHGAVHDRLLQHVHPVRPQYGMEKQQPRVLILSYLPLLSFQLANTLDPTDPEPRGAAIARRPDRAAAGSPGAHPERWWCRVMFFEPHTRTRCITKRDPPGHLQCHGGHQRQINALALVLDALQLL